MKTLLSKPLKGSEIFKMDDKHLELYEKFKDFTLEELDKAIKVLNLVKNDLEEKTEPEVKQETEQQVQEISQEKTVSSIKQFLEIIDQNPKGINLDKALDNLRFKQVINSLTTIASEFLNISNTISKFNVTKKSGAKLTDKIRESIQLLDNELFHLEANILHISTTPQIDLDIDIEPILCDDKLYTTIAYFFNEQLQNDATCERKLKVVKLIMFILLYSLRLENLFLNHTFSQFKIFNYKVGFEINYVCNEFSAVTNAITTKPLEMKDDNNLNAFSYMLMTIQNFAIDTIHTIINSLTKKFTDKLIDQELL